MNIPEPPLNTELLDELLSADLDGEFERAAADLGLEPRAARAAIDATPDAARRRAALERARALIATPPPLDPERVDALVAAAVDAVDAPDEAVAPVPLRARRSTRAWQAVAGIAAAAAVVVGIVAVAGTNTGSNASKSMSADREAAGDAATTVPAGTGPTRTSIAFGNVSQPGALESRVRDLLPPEGAPAIVPQATSGSGRVTLGTSESNRYAADAAKSAARRGIQACTRALRRRASLGSAPVLSGSGTAGGQPVYVLVFDDAGGRVAYVVAAADCSVVTRVPVS
jgi:hypothetical protein